MTPRHRATALLTATALLAAACGTGSDDPESSAPSPTASATAPEAATTTPPAATPSPTPSPTPDPVPEPAPAADTTYDDPAELAEVLVTAERVIRDPEVPVDRIEGWSRVEQSLYRQLADRPEWHDQVRAAVPADLQDVYDLNLRATVELRKLTSPREALPEWRIIEPVDADLLIDAYKTAADEFGIDWTLLAAINLIETRMGRIRGDSTAGARGPMQFIPPTWDAYGQGDIEDPYDAIRAAAFYLADHGAPEDVDDALWAYNHSDRYVQAVKDHAAVIRLDERAYHAYHDWQVYYRLTSGDVILEVGYDGTA